jgi:hypothetical protein
LEKDDPFLTIPLSAVYNYKECMIGIHMTAFLGMTHPILLIFSKSIS